MTRDGIITICNKLEIPTLKATDPHIPTKPDHMDKTEEGSDESTSIDLDLGITPTESPNIQLTIPSPQPLELKPSIEPHSST